MKTDGAFLADIPAPRMNSNNNQHLKSKHNIFIYQRIISDIIPFISAIAG